MLEPGAPLDRYVIEALVGTGAMGKVYRAFDTRLHRAVALKVLDPVFPEGGEAGSDPASTDDAIIAALREARAAAAILHPNATAIFDADRISGVSFIVMEFVPGTPLRKLVGDASVPLGARVRWLVEIAGALAAAHRAGVIHRDVKPENVIVRNDGLVKVLDFGIARLPRGPLGRTTATTGGGLLGTPPYMAPEQIRGEPDLDGRADQFAWGVVAYELLTGRMPWLRPDEPFALLTSLLSEDPPPFPTEADVPLEIESAVRTALSKVRDDRFPSMVEAAAALAPFVGPRITIGRAEAHTPTFGMESLAAIVLQQDAITLTSNVEPRPLRWEPPPTPRPAALPEPNAAFKERIAPSATSVPPPPAPAPPPRASPEPWQRTLESGALAASCALAFEAPPMVSPTHPPAAPAPAPPLAMPLPPSAPRLAPPDFGAPVDLEAHLALLPRNATCKGMFFIDLVRLGTGSIPTAELYALAAVPERRYVVFRDYPANEYLRLATTVAATTYPDVPIGEGLRRIGQTVFDTVAASLVGKTLFGAFGAELEPILLNGPRAYKLLVNFGDVTADKIAPGMFVFRAREFPVFLSTFQIGILEGVMEHAKAQGRIAIAQESLSAATVELSLP